MNYRNSENWEELWNNIESGDLLTESKKIEEKTTKLNESAKCPRPHKQLVEKLFYLDLDDAEFNSVDKLIREFNDNYKIVADVSAVPDKAKYVFSDSKGRDYYKEYDTETIYVLDGEKQRITEEAEKKDCKDGKCDKNDELSDAEKKRFSKVVKVAKPEENLDECGDNLEEKKCCGKDCKDELDESVNFSGETPENLWTIASSPSYDRVYASVRIRRKHPNKQFPEGEAFIDNEVRVSHGTAYEEAKLYFADENSANTFLEALKRNLESFSPRAKAQIKDMAVYKVPRVDEYMEAISIDTEFGPAVIDRQAFDREEIGFEGRHKKLFIPKRVQNKDLDECGDNFEKELSEAFMAGYRASLREGKTK